MLAALETRAREAASELGPIDEAFFEASGQVADGGVPALLESAGYTAVRYGFQMVRPTLDDAPDAPMPDGLEIREVREEDLRKIWDAADEAFRDGWGYRAPTEEDYQVFLADPLSQDRSLWRVAWDGDEVAGQVRGFINEDANRAFGRKWGWVENISVRRPWRRRGLARALMNETFKALRERGMTEGTLGVDALNPTGALRIYESIGFRPVSESRVYRKPFPARAR
jgi:ribosomal protein S18 acetylase RimI-like enzyme